MQRTIPQRTILVTGATGTVGRSLVRELAARGIAVRGATRSPRRAARIGVPADEWVLFDLERPATFAPALRGVDALFLVSRPGDGDPVRLAAPLVHEAVRQGVRRVVNLSALGADRREDVTLGRLERLLEREGLVCTHLRPNWFMQVFASAPLLAGIRATGRIRIPAGDARISYVDARDVASVAAAVLGEPGHDRSAYTLTGGEALDHRAVAAHIAAASGRRVEYVPVDESEARTAIVESGLGPDRAERLIRFYRLVRAGECKEVSTDVERILGRPPIPFPRFAREQGDCWRYP